MAAATPPPAPTASPLPGADRFASKDAMRDWYRANVVALVARPDLNNCDIATAAGVSGTSVKNWFKQATGMTPHDYRVIHGLPKRTSPPARPVTPMTRLRRRVRDVTCFDGTTTDVVLDLRADRKARARTASAVLGRTPNPATKQWHQTVATPSYPRPWTLLGYGVGTNIGHAASVLLATTHLDDGTRWRMAFIADGRTHGKFALSWAKETLPHIADALAHHSGVKSHSRHDYGETQAAAAPALINLAAAMDDPALWDGDTTSWESAPAERLEERLRWAAAGVLTEAYADAFLAHRWGPRPVSDMRHYFGITDLDAILTAIEATGETRLLHRIAGYIETQHLYS